MLTKLVIEKLLDVAELRQALEEGNTEKFYQCLASRGDPGLAEMEVRFQISRRISTWAAEQVYWRIETPIICHLENYVCRTVSWRLQDELLRVWKVRNEDQEDMED